MAVQKLAPQVTFWYKDHATLDELAALVSDYHHPVGVEWQGLFEDDDEDEGDENDEDDDEEAEEDGDSETGDDDYGHYSVVVEANTKERKLLIADPYKDYIDQVRIFSFDDFEMRWWDYNEVVNPKTGKSRLVKDYHMLFIITEPDEVFPLKFGLNRAFDPSLDTAQ
jgi:hypothetical protein